MALKLQELIAKHTKDGVTDFDAVEQAIDNDYVNPIVAKSKPDVEKIKADVLKDAETAIYEKLGLEGVTDEASFKAYSKRMGATTDETKEALEQIRTEKEELASKYSDIETQFNELKGNNTTLQRTNKITPKFDAKYHDLILPKLDAELTKMGDDADIDTAIATLEETYPEFKVGYKQGKGNDLPGGSGEVASMIEEFNKGLGNT